MEIYQKLIAYPDPEVPSDIPFEPDLILLFSAPGRPAIEEFVRFLQAAHPGAILAGCSTAGEIMDNAVYDGTIALTALRFADTKICKDVVEVAGMRDSYEAGARLGQKLYGELLQHVIVLSDGLHVNGAELVSGLRNGMERDTSITGGLAGDGSEFNRTFIIDGDRCRERAVIGIGFYGHSLKLGYSSKAGWTSFGIERKVTRSKDNVLYELDGIPALQLYKSYLGEKARDLPSSGLLFPLSMRDKESSLPVIRTILAVDEQDQSLTFAGNIPEGSYVRLMKANVDRLINGAEQSAILSRQLMPSSPELAILISCVGRRLVLKQLVEEEIEAVREVLGSNTAITGFYSYGEIAPFGVFSPCELHNQTMTITTLTETSDN